MKTRLSNSSKKVEYFISDLNSGDPFVLAEWTEEEEVFMRFTDSEHPHNNAICLSNCKPCYVGKDTPILPVDGEFVYSYRKE